MYLQESQGFGKSSLTNMILGKVSTEIGDISKKNKRGKNTTTDITLYEIKENSYLLDTPGFQAIDIFEIEKENLDKCFREFKPYIKNCEFVGCTHIKEENCGIKNALNEGKIRESRYQNYIKIYEELKEWEEHKW